MEKLAGCLYKHTFLKIETIYPRYKEFKQDGIDYTIGSTATAQATKYSQAINNTLKLIQTIFTDSWDTQLDYYKAQE